MPTVPRLPIEQNDTVRTGAGRVKIVFVDQTTVSVTEQSKLVIDTFVYSGKPSTSKMALKFASGTVRFATGKGIAKPNINLKTPTATIAVRGTDFVSTVDDFGKSLIILLPEEDGSVGEITVFNGAGSVIMNKAFQATMVTTADTPPSKPVVLNITIGMIDNMLIVSPPDEVKDSIEEIDTRANILDLSELDIDFLKNNDLDHNEINVQSIDIVSIDTNFLDENLNDALAKKEGSKDGVRIEGTNIGMDEQTQILTIIQDDKVRIVRSVNNYQDINVSAEQGKNISITDTGKSFNVIVNTGGSGITTIQGN